MRERNEGKNSVFLNYLITLFQLEKLRSLKYDTKTVTICETMGKDFVGDDHSPFRRILHGVSSGNAEKATTSLSESSRARARDLKSGLSEYETAALTNGSQSSEIRGIFISNICSLSSSENCISAPFLHSKYLGFTLLSSTTPLSPDFVGRTPTNSYLPALKM